MCKGESRQPTAEKLVTFDLKNIYIYIFFLQFLFPFLIHYTALAQFLSFVIRVNVIVVASTYISVVNVVCCNRTVDS